MPRLAVVVLLGALVSGCFASDRPMFAPDTAVRALDDGGRYATFEQDQGKEKPSHPLPNGEHVAQVKLEGNSGYGYVLARVSGKDVLVVPAECNRQDAAKMAVLGVVQRTQFECRIDNVADPVTFFVGLKRSEPVSRMARE
jgi:hypothetical protein